MRENTDQKNSKYGNFSCREMFLQDPKQVSEFIINIERIYVTDFKKSKCTAKKVKSIRLAYPVIKSAKSN